MKSYFGVALVPADRSCFPNPARPEELRAAQVIVSLHRSGMTRRAIVEHVNAMRLPGARAWHGTWNAWLVGAVIRRRGGRRLGRPASRRK